MALTVFVFGILALPALIAAGVLMWGATALLIDAWHCRHPRLDIIDPLPRLRSRSVADEAEEWLSRQ